jgi:hypothetical protein
VNRLHSEPIGAAKRGEERQELKDRILRLRREFSH